MGLSELARVSSKPVPEMGSSPLALRSLRGLYRSLYYKFAESCFSGKIFGGSSDLESHLPAEPPGPPRAAGLHPEGTRGGWFRSPWTGLDPGIRSPRSVGRRPPYRVRCTAGGPALRGDDPVPGRPRCCGSPATRGVAPGAKACRYLDHLRHFGCGREAALRCRHQRLR